MSILSIHTQAEAPLTSGVVKWLLEKFACSTLTIYDTPSRKKRPFKSIQPNVVQLYSCGPTVYSDAHIWNLRSYIFPDILKKVLAKIGYRVDHIINITDVGHLTDDANDGDDKMELIAHKQQGSVWDISKRCTEAFMWDLKLLHIEFPKMFTKATEYIWAQIEMIDKLEQKWHTYCSGDGVYFDTSTFPKYAEFAWLDVDNLNEGERVSFWDKRNKTDFALWKFSPPTWPKRQMEWESPWWKGFPGWHIECSAMIWKELGDKIDIHTWWSDHIPVHHTNEVAQATCCNGTSPANYWLHGEFLVLDWNEKIGKSKWNSMTLSGLMEKGFDPLSYRYLVLMAHYRSFLTFSEPILKGAQTGLKNLKKDIKKISDAAQNWENILLTEDAEKFASKIMNCFLDDLNTPMALAAFREMLSSKISSEEKVILIRLFDEIFDLWLLDFSWNSDESVPKEILQIAQRRWDLKSEKKFQEADEVRRELEKLWYKMNDGKDSFNVIKI